MELFNDLKTMLKKNIREYGMFIALFAIMLVFSILSDGVFMSPRNISNLINSMGYIAVLAVGMTLILVIKHIDLSVGFVAGFLGAVAATLLTSYNLPVLAVIPVVLAIGVLIGLFNGFLVAKLQIPAFVVTLAGMLIFRGALLQVTAKTGTIIVPNQTFNNIGVGYIPDPVKLIPGFHTLTLVLGALFIVYYIWSQFKNRKNKLKYNFEVVPIKIFYIKMVFVSFLIGYVTYILSDYNGLSWTVVIVLIVVAIYHFMTTKTVLGRHIYAVGGNDEAAKLSGIDVKKVTLFVFASMSMLAALSGILFTARLQSATVTAGTGFELDAIASAYVGGVSAAGGVGRVTGSIIGALVMASLTSGMNLLNVGASYQYIIRGAILILAVVFDVQTRNKSK
ncbi:sugar ABC transporter permease [Proteiniclasticum sp. SCR006]|uniref:Xylose transport system permease protein XylH n=1 Tax=Proteiniclasticum aestuarii TaxID=2817862 RepID=A0A939H811_9CLOT|nr:sugar ABC transporter permease [Proteiniclasticum aestuarii]MBO1266012.1 sugar ABC transporter permease [Proteiniclasticum aestuarii]